MSKHLVDDWRDCWRWFSMHAMALTLAIQGTWLELPDEFKAHVPDQLVHVMTFVLLIAGIVGRLMRQERS